MANRKNPKPYDVDYKILIIGESRVGNLFFIADKRLSIK